MPEFNQNLARLHAKIQRQIKAKVQDVLHNPYRKSEQLKAPEFGSKRRIESGNYRLTYMVCKDCLEKGLTAHLECPDCGPHRETWIRFFDVGPRPKYYAKAIRKEKKTQEEEEKEAVTHSFFKSRN